LYHLISGEVIIVCLFIISILYSAYHHCKTLLVVKLDKVYAYYVCVCYI